MNEDLTKLDGVELHRRIEAGRQVATLLRPVVAGYPKIGLSPVKVIEIRDALLASIEWNRRLAEQCHDLCNPTLPRPEAEAHNGL